ncbi:hypothetical protein IP87_04590 [beta proteobacterium AAP121]|nr:hypothetical protein IP80_06700 [beta proteobacterium AAP65]KPF99775.1 hypothetical protein IP87_04590 [beta proteobacterium AAP121]
MEKPATRSEAARFLAQASFGATDASIDRVMAVGYAVWIDEQLALPATRAHRLHWDAADAALKAVTPTAAAGQDQVFESFWKQAVTGNDQLRQRVAYALSQIFVISLVDGTVGQNPRAVAAWMDMLGDEGLGTYRNLLETVSRHPMMGVYLSHLRNQKADPRTGRVPDENYAREVMQLFSLGLVELNEDGTPRTSGGAPIDTYTPADISGMAKVFTGWSWACPDWPDNSCFSQGTANGNSDPDRAFKAMLGYPQYHSTEAKTFLGTTIAAQSQSDPAASLKTALDTLAGHANVGPFIGRQLIQRLVTSNPSPAYVRAVAQAFANNGSGVRGDMKAVVKAVLMHPEARQVSDSSGKVREPVLKLAAYLRAFPHSSDTGSWRMGNTDNPATSLGQTPMRSPSVFNFYRPGYVAPGTASATSNLVAPELQIAHETSVAAWVNFMRDNVASGVGQNNGTVGGVVLNRRDIRPDFTAELALAGDPAALVERVAEKLTYGQAGAALKAEIATGVGSIAIPALNTAGSNQAAIDTARRNRVNAAVLLVLAAPEFQVQR